MFDQHVGLAWLNFFSNFSSTFFSDICSIFPPKHSWVDNSVLNVVPDKIVPEVAVALTEAVMDAVPEDALGGKKLENPVPDAPSASEVLAETVLKSVPDELVSEVAVALTKKVIEKIPEKDMSVSSSGTNSIKSKGSGQ